jgi:transketolase
VLRAQKFAVTSGAAPGDVILRNFGFTAEHVTAAALRLLGRRQEADQEYKG